MARTTHVDDSLFHVSQRLDALAADDEHAYLYFSRVLTPAETSLAPAQVPAQRPRTATITARQHRRRKAWYAQLTGLSSFYLRFAAFIGACYFVAAFIVTAAALIVAFTPPALFTNKAITEESMATQLSRELIALAGGAALGALLLGSLADHFGRRVLLLVASACQVIFQVASGFMWTHWALITARALIGFGVGGMLVLLPIVLSEFSAQRRRGRVVVLGMACLSLGSIAAVHSAQRLVELTTWTILTSAGFGAAQFVIFVMLAVFLTDPPRFLAAIGRVDAAMGIVQAIENSHGINRNARVTMPSSLFEPPSQDFESFHNTRRQSRVSRLSMRRGSLYSNSVNTAGEPYGNGAPRRRRTSAALTPGMVSLRASFAKRWKRVLWCRPYARRSAGLAFLWLLVATGVSVSFAVTACFTSVGHDRILLLTCISAAAVFGLVLCAAIIDSTGRVPMLCTSLVGSSVAIAMVGVQLYLDLKSHVFISAACSLLSLAGSVALSTSVVWTLEHFGVLIRATGMGLTFTGGCLGLAAGQWVIWTSFVTKNAAHFVVWGVAGLFILVALLTWCKGDETRGEDDVDSVIIEEPTLPVGLQGIFERDSSEKHLNQPRSTYHSKEPNFMDDVERSIGRTESSHDAHSSFEPPASASSAASTYIGSSMSRSSSNARHSSSVRFSQRGLSSATRSSRRTSSGTGSRGSRGSSLTRSVPLSSTYTARHSMAATYRRHVSSLGGSGHMQRSLLARGEVPSTYTRRSSSRTDHPPNFIIRRSSLTRGSPRDADLSPVLRVRGASRAELPRSSFDRETLTFASLTQTLPARLDPHSVRERLGRRSSEDESSSSNKSDDYGEHDVLSIDIDPFDSGRFMPILG